MTDLAMIPRADIEVIVLDSDGEQLGSTITDENDYYFIYYKHKGKEAAFNILLPEYNQQKDITIKANKIGDVNFII